MAKKEKQEPVLYIFSDRSILVNEEGVEYKFHEGKTSDEAKKRLAVIKGALEKGFLEKLIVECQDPEVTIEKISKEHITVIESLVNSVTTDVKPGFLVFSACSEIIFLILLLHVI